MKHVKQEMVPKQESRLNRSNKILSIEILQIYKIENKTNKKRQIKRKKPNYCCYWCTVAFLKLTSSVLLKDLFVTSMFTICGCVFEGLWKGGK